MNNISSDPQKLFRFFNGRANIACIKILCAPPTSLFPNNSTLYLKDLKLSLFTISLLKLVVSSLE